MAGYKRWLDTVNEAAAIGGDVMELMGQSVLGSGASLVGAAEGVGAGIGTALAGGSKSEAVTRAANKLARRQKMVEEAAPAQYKSDLFNSKAAEVVQSGLEWVGEKVQSAGKAVGTRTPGGPEAQTATHVATTTALEEVPEMIIPGLRALKNLGKRNIAVPGYKVDPEKVERAHALKLEGKPSLDIAKETGMIWSEQLNTFVAELPPNESKLLPYGTKDGKTVSLGDKVTRQLSILGDGETEEIKLGGASNVIDFKKLYDVYPDLKRSKVTLQVTATKSDTAGWYDRANDEFIVVLDEDTPRDAAGIEARIKETLHHEIQHAVQKREDWVGGTSVTHENTQFNTLFKPGVGDALRVAASDAAARGDAAARAALVYMDGFERYLRNYGEWQARQAETRANMSAEELASTPFGMSKDPYNIPEGNTWGNSISVNALIASTPFLLEHPEVAKWLTSDKKFIQALQSGSVQPVQGISIDVDPEQIAYHGSGRSTVKDKFNPNGIGGGEGTQWEGRGFYFTQKPGVADFYRKQALELRGLNTPATVYMADDGAVIKDLAAYVDAQIASEGKIAAPDPLSSWQIRYGLVKDGKVMKNIHGNVANTAGWIDALEHDNVYDDLVEKGLDKALPEFVLDHIKPLMLQGNITKPRVNNIAIDESAHIYLRNITEEQLTEITSVPGTAQKLQVLATDTDVEGTLSAIINVPLADGVQRLSAYAKPDATGRVYKVDIPEDEELLNFHDSIKEQPEQVRKAVNRIRSMVGFPESYSGISAYDTISEYMQVFRDDVLGKTSEQQISSITRTFKVSEDAAVKIRDELVQDVRDERVGRGQPWHGGASQLLLAYGVPGLRYRGSEKRGDYWNFVVWDYDRIVIMDSDTSGERFKQEMKEAKSAQK